MNHTAATKNRMPLEGHRKAVERLKTGQGYMPTGKTKNAPKAKFRASSEQPHYHLIVETFLGEVSPFPSCTDDVLFVCVYCA